MVGPNVFGPKESHLTIADRRGTRILKCRRCRGRQLQTGSTGLGQATLTEPMARQPSGEGCQSAVPRMPVSPTALGDPCVGVADTVAVSDDVDDAGTTIASNEARCIVALQSIDTRG